MCPFSGTQPLVSRVLAEKLRILPPSASNFPPCVVETRPKICFTLFQSFFLRESFARDIRPFILIFVKIFQILWGQLFLTNSSARVLNLSLRASFLYSSLRGINLRLACFLCYLFWEFLNRIIWCYKKRFRPFVAIVRANLLNISVLRNVPFISSPGELCDMLVWMVYRVF